MIRCRARTEEEVCQRLEAILDTSNFPVDHPMYSTERRRIPGFIKCEVGLDKTIHSAVFLRSKLYSLQLAPRLPVPEDGGQVYLHDTGTLNPPELKEGEITSRNKCKGIGRAAARNLRFEQYRDMVTSMGEVRTDVHHIRGFEHRLYKMVSNKRALGSAEDKFFYTCAQVSFFKVI